MPYKDPEKAKAYHREYRQRHREKIRAYMRKYDQDHKEEKRAYMQKYHQDHKEERAAYHQQHKEEKRAYEKERDQKVRQQALEILGNKCLLCGSRSDLHFHEKDGENHPSRTPLLVLKNPERFRLLCAPHHKAVHVLMERGYKWDDIEAFSHILL